MWEYDIIHKDTGEITCIGGYSFGDACRRSGLDPNEWDVILSTYVD